MYPSILSFKTNNKLKLCFECGVPMPQDAGTPLTQCVLEGVFLSDKPFVAEAGDIGSFFMCVFDGIFMSKTDTNVGHKKSIKNAH
jgi:hypothetical protein